MAENSKIEWTHHTFNPWRGCTKVSDGCKFCYADELSKRNPSTLGIWGPKGTRAIAAESYWKQAAKWQKEAKAAGERRRVFCSSLADVFEGQDTMPAEAWEPVEAARARLFRTIYDTPDLDWLLLTKRPENIRETVYRHRQMCKDQELYDGLLWPWAAGRSPHNVWLGTSVEDMRVADRVDDLRQAPAMVRFLSCEPLIGSLHNLDLTDIGWVIVGGESGANARPFDPNWAYELMDECIRLEIPFFFKQMGDNAVDSKWGPVTKRAHHGTDWVGYGDLRTRDFPKPGVQVS